MEDDEFLLDLHRKKKYEEEEIISKVFETEETKENKEVIRKLLEAYMKLLEGNTIRADGKEYEIINSIIEGSPFLKHFLMKRGKDYFSFGQKWQ